MLTLGEILRRNAETVSTKPAFVYRSEGLHTNMSYGELNRTANRLANRILDDGVPPLGRVALLSRNHPQLPVAMWGAVKAGAIAMPLNFRYTSAEIAGLLAKDPPYVLFVEDELLPPLLSGPASDLLGRVRLVSFGASASELPMGLSWVEYLDGSSEQEPDVDVSENDPHMLLCTSGTTGQAKGVLQSHRSWYLQTGNPVLSERGTGENDIGLCPYQLFHSSGWRTSVIFWRARATVVILRRPSVREVVAAIEEERVTQFVALPQTLLQVCEAGTEEADLSSLLAINTGTSSISAGQGQRIKEVFGAPEFRVHYGASEAGPVSSLTGDEFLERPTSVGRPTLHVDVRIVDNQGVELKIGNEGEVTVRSDFTMLGYRDQPEDTTGALCGGWYHTGDLGRLDGDGYLYITGRLKELIRSAGESIYPNEVEDCVRSHPAVMDCAAVGLPDERWGECVGMAVVLSSPEITVKELHEYVRKQLASYKTPREFIFVDTIPRVEATGKVARAQVAKLFGA